MVTAGFWFARSIGGAVGVAVMGAILFDRLSALLGSGQVASQLLQGSQGAALSVSAAVKGVVAESFQTVFWASATLFLVALVGVGFLPGGLMKEAEEGMG